jgi:hypothetical protein
MLSNEVLSAKNEDLTGYHFCGHNGLMNGSIEPTQTEAIKAYVSEFNVTPTHCFKIVRHHHLGYDVERTILCAGVVEHYVSA